jgi:ribosomal protein S18 acetylase RimI-like enzyme/catechol 2,3-dioxygenase-like lactoylglutathione lyase family enzyme
MANDFDIRPARRDDLPQVIALLRSQLEEHDVTLEDAALAGATRALVEQPSLGRVLVAAGDDGTLAGVAVLSFMWTLEHGGRAAWLDELYVAPGRRRHGLGRRLTKAALAVAAEHGAIALDLEVEDGHEAAEELYRSMGFRRHRRVRWAYRFEVGHAPARSAPGAHAGAVGVPATGAHRPFASLDHMSLGVNDLARSKRFYDAALAPLGLVPHQQVPSEVGYGPPGESPEEGYAFYIGFEDPAAKRPVEPSAGFHVALRAPSRAAVRAFHAAALAAGGRDGGAPGLRPRYHASYYGAFVVDPDGHHVEAVCHAPEG